MKQEEINVSVANVKKQYPDVVFKCQELDNGSFVCIMQGGLQQKNPMEYMDNAVFLFVGNELYKEFIDKSGYPWVRVIILGFNKNMFE